MTTAIQEIQEYLHEKGTNYLTNPIDLKSWLERKYGRRMNRPLFTAVGQGGGQRYKTLWEVFDVRGNRGRPCYFYNEIKKTINILEDSGHRQLQYWLDHVESMPEL